MSKITTFVPTEDKVDIPFSKRMLSYKYHIYSICAAEVLLFLAKN